MPIEPHPLLLPPPDGAILWRYLDLAKFLLLLETKTLWIPRADQFDDPLEGTHTDAEVEILRSHDVSNKQTAPTYSESLIRLTRQMRATAYVNCWREGADESMAMWDLYGKGTASVAIKTTVSKLKEAFDESAYRSFLSRVSYVDWGQFNPLNNNLLMCFRKDSSYQHEREVRAIVWDQSLVTKNIADAMAWAGISPTHPDAMHDAIKLQTPQDGVRGIEVSFDPERFLKEIVVGPRESSAVVDLFESLLKRYGLTTKLYQSNRLRVRK